MSALAKRSIFLLGMLTLIVLATLWAWPGTAQGASLDVTKTADTDDGACDADCSLREAIAAALAGDTINVPIGTYTLTMGTELIINVDLTLTGAGSGDTIIQAAASSADATSRVFNITSATVAISDVTIQNANTVGAGGGIINSFGTLTLTNSTVSENTAGGGGGISNFGTATLTNSTVTGNTASGGGGISNEPGSTLVINSSTISGNTAKGAFGSGGGIVNWVGGTVTLTGSTVSGNTANLNGGGIWNGVNGTVTLTDSTVSGNIALGASFVGGGGIYNDGTLTMANSAGIFNDSLGTVTLTNSIVSDNSINVSNKAAGGIYNGGGTLTLTNSTVSGNMATGGGGGIRNIGTLILTSSTVSGNASTDSNGGGIYNAGGTVTLTDLIVSGNMATENGGGLFNSGGTVILTNSIVSGNSAILNGGGIAFTSGTATLANSTVSGNTAEFGGGIYSAGGSLILANSTASGNAADFGGGIYNFGGTVTLTNSTVSGNTVTDGGNGGGIDNFSGTIELVNTIIAENTAAGGPDCLGSLTSLGYNLIGDDTDCGYTAATGDLLNVGPLLGPLQDNGGPTFTHALLAGSPAIDAIPVADCNDINGVPVTTDQRGVARPQGSDCDIGSFELEPPPDPECTLNLALTYVDGTLTMEFEVGTLEPAQWGIWFLAQGNVSLKRKTIMGVTDPPILVSRSIPGYPAQGTVGVLTSLSTQGSGAICSAWQTVDTGTP